ncbi:glycosyltransferase [Lapidilactobacillus bayanensis]|uniref:glycosyltransferase n=1 Tax=Lapidilactobacillus bayanensis TaxID=2485998 RepID=UPI000F77CF63|nr:glycosyltransferase [Lapidilactobacillus bayanensis]
MRIAIVSPGFGYGGSYIVASNVGKELQKDQDNEVFYLAYQYHTNFSGVPDERLHYFGHNVGRVRQNIIRVGKAVELLTRHEFTPIKYRQHDLQALLNEIDQNKIDVVILNTFLSVTLFAQQLKQLRPGVKIVGWLHEATSYSFGNLTKNYRQSFINGLRALDRLVCLTNIDLQKMLTVNSRSQIIYNPVVLPEHEISALQDKVVSFTTRLNVHIKGLDYLMEIANQIEDGWSIRVAGQGRPEQVTEFKELLEKNGNPSKINFVGELVGNDLTEHYLHSSIFISTSRTEALPLVLIEAMSFGLPIISFDHNGAKEILADGKYGELVAIGDVQGMATAINNLANSPEKMRQLQQLSLSRYDDFKMPVIIKKWRDLLNQLFE